MAQSGHGRDNYLNFKIWILVERLMDWKSVFFTITSQFVSALSIKGVHETIKSFEVLLSTFILKRLNNKPQNENRPCSPKWDSFDLLSHHQDCYLANEILRWLSNRCWRDGSLNQSDPVSGPDVGQSESLKYYFESIPERFKNPPCSKSDLSTQLGRLGSGCQLPLRQENWLRVDSAKVKPSSQKTWQISVPSDSIWQTVSAFSGGTKIGHRWADRCPRKNNPIWVFILILLTFLWVLVFEWGQNVTESRRYPKVDCPKIQNWADIAPL